ncbi:MAG: peptide-methionine (S)-S-oxide reductase MsrA [Candidatus Nanohalobium sp.]
METAVLGGGCFWCIEAAYKGLKEVENVVSGYAGGRKESPAYREVCSGETGHAEVVKVQYNEEEISYREILEFLFRIHNPTTKDRQGPDTGSQYRSIILYQNSEQKETAEKFLEEKQSEYKDRIVTELKELNNFWKAEEKHQDYFEKNPEDAYCTMHAQPKVEKARKF